MTGPDQPLLDVRDLAISFELQNGRVAAVDGVSFAIRPGETLGIVGESGSGKSVTAYGLVGLLAGNGRVDRGQIVFDGQDLLAGSGRMRAVRGRGIAFIFQNPRAALNPIRRVGDQVRDALVASGRADRGQSAARALEWLERVRIERAKARFDAYPHELSGGMCQRVLIAMALAAEPKLLIADEPTTGLDVTTQKVIMDTVYELSARQGLATLLITHDVGLAARYCRNIAVMREGKIVEAGTAAQVLQRPAVSYTQRLVAATPCVGRTLNELLPPSEREAFAAKLSRASAAATPSHDDTALLEVRGLGKTFEAPDQGNGLIARLRGWLTGPASRGEASATGIHAVRDVNMTLGRGARLGIVGESGSGKTTTSRMIARLLDQTAGRISFKGADIGAVPSSRFSRSPLRHRIQVVFQDPLGSLNPRFTAYQAILNPLCRAEPSLAQHEQQRRILGAAEQAGFDTALLDRYPHQLSGGQQARVGLARALVVGPDLLILDEPTSALDVSIQAVVLNQLDLLHRRLGLAYILVSHDLNVIRLMCDHVLVMRSGEIVEAGDTEAIFRSPSHPYTRELMAAIPHFPADGARGAA
jgi:peptide/nickel transport system ATP-binding protein